MQIKVKILDKIDKFLKNNYPNHNLELGVITVEFYQTFSKEIIPLGKVFWRTDKKGGANSLYRVTNIVIPELYKQCV